MAVDVIHSNIDAYDWVLDVLVRSHTRQVLAGWPLYGRRCRELKPAGSALATMLERIRGFANLTQDWDSYGALPPSEVALTRTRWILNHLPEWLPEVHHANPFALVPLTDGGIQLDWERPGLSLEVEINPDGSLGFLLVEGDGEGRRFTERDDASLVEVIGLIRRVVISSTPE